MQTDWTEFCGWIREALGMPKLPLDWSLYEKDGFKIVRIDLFKNRPFHVTTVLEDRWELCNPEVADLLSRDLMPVLRKAVAAHRPYTYIRHFDIKVVV